VFSVGDKIELLGLSVVAVDQSKVTLETLARDSKCQPTTSSAPRTESNYERLPCEAAGAGGIHVSTADDCILRAQT
jgi:hypothetical protein